MVLKVFLSGNFGRWIVELPKGRIDDDNGHCVDFCWGCRNRALMEVSGWRSGPIYKGRQEYSRECGGMTGAEKPRRSAFSFLSHPHCQNFPALPQNFIFLTVYRKNPHHAHFPQKCAYHVNPPYLIYAKKRTRIVYQKMQCKFFAIIWVS